MLEPAGPPLQGDRHHGAGDSGGLDRQSDLLQDQLAQGRQVLGCGEDRPAGLLIILKCCADRGNDLSESFSKWKRTYLLAAR